MIFLNSDGGARGNPGPGAVGVIARDEKNTILSKYSNFIGENVTNNEAEYEALIEALNLAKNIGDKEIVCILDSELVVKQLLGEYKVKDRRMKEKFLKVQKLLNNFEKVKFENASRWDNFQKLADELVNKELNRRGYFKKIFKKK